MPTVSRFDHGVCCLSEICDDILMWSHYAAQHTGVCIGIRPDRIAGKLFRPVEYSDVVPLLDAWEYIRGDGDKFLKLGLTKASHWSYEKEWRTVDLFGLKQYPSCVDRIVIGLGRRAKQEKRYWMLFKTPLRLVTRSKFSLLARALCTTS